MLKHRLPNGAKKICDKYSIGTFSLHQMVTLIHLRLFASWLAIEYRSVEIKYHMVPVILHSPPLSAKFCETGQCSFRLDSRQVSTFHAKR